ncbi:MAG TPA: glycosyltransferase [Gammaproteobacteria bacterium]|nr:glycosyltransferase [Gammaproteobacteria bacterium]
MSQSPIALFLSTSGHSGVDRTMKHLIPALAGRGYRVDLLKVRRHGPNLDFQHPFFRTVDLGTRHTYAALPAVVRYLRRERPAVLFSDKDRVCRTALLAAKLARSSARLIFSVGTTISVDLAHRGALERWIQRNSMGRLYPLADQVIANSQGVADDLANYTGLSRSHITVAPRPVVPDALLTQQLPRPEHPWFALGEPPLILGVGELSDRKGFDVLLRAFAKLREDRPCRLMILGKGNRREQLLLQAADLGVSEDFALPGFVDNPYVYMAHASLLAMTSRWEGLGFALIEAMAVGTPVVASNCPSGPAEVLNGGRFGKLVAVNDVDGLWRAMADTLNAPQPAEHLKQAIRPYMVSTATDRYLEVFGLPLQAPT